jgi:hypothetical protein
MYVRSSRVGKGLYERFGWRVMGGEGGNGFIIELKASPIPWSIIPSRPLYWLQGGVQCSTAPGPF